MQNITEEIEVVNLTGKTVIFYEAYSNEMEIPPDGEEVFLSRECLPIGFFKEGIPIVRHFFKTVNLPLEKEKTVFLVSENVARFRSDRMDLIFPSGIIHELDDEIYCNRIGVAASQ